MSITLILINPILVQVCPSQIHTNHWETLPKHWEKSYLQELGDTRNTVGNSLCGNIDSINNFTDNLVTEMNTSFQKLHRL